MPEEIKPLLARTARLAQAILKEIAKRERQIEASEDLQCVTIVVRLTPAGKPRTVLFRSESKSELQSG